MAAIDLEKYHHKLQDDTLFFSKHCLYIKTKEGTIVPFEVNKAQAYLHEQLEKQLHETGKIRAFVIKGRQQGCSTYISARFYHKATRIGGKAVYILAHDLDTTNKLFDIAKRYHDRCPAPARPATKASNRKELKFNEIESNYYVGTAGSGAGGRGGTVQYFHGSEVAFWNNTDEIQTGVMQSVPDLPGTEIVLESTANGPKGMFYNLIQQALKGKSEYIVVFIPWFWQDEYKKELPDDFQITEDEQDLKDTYDLTDEQIYWRRMKIEEFEGREWKFKQEYPNNVQEAFQTSGTSLFSGEKIMRARTCDYKDKQAPLVIGVDPAREGDRTVICFRRGREMPVIYTYEKMDEMLLAGKLAKAIETYDPHMVNIDVGLGYGTIDRLRELGYSSIVNDVHFGSKPIDETYLNKRAEMYLSLKKWLDEPSVNIPNDEKIHQDLAAIPDFIETSSGKIQIIDKKKIKEESGFSPDIVDAMALTFAFPVRRKNSQKYKQKQTQPELKSRRTNLKTSNNSQFRLNKNF